MAQPPQMPQQLIKIFVESGLAEIRRIEDQAVGELMLRSPRKMMAELEQRTSTPRGDREPTGNENGSEEQNGGLSPPDE